MKTNLCSSLRQARPVSTARFSFRFAAHVVVFLFAGGALTVGLHAQRGGQAPAAQPSGPRPATAPPLVPVRLDVDGNFRIAPPYANDPAFTEKPNVPKGRVVRFTMNSAESKIFPTAPVGAARGAAPTRTAAAGIPASGRRLHSCRVCTEHTDAVHRRAGWPGVRQRCRSGWESRDR